MVPLLWHWLLGVCARQSRLWLAHGPGGLDHCPCQVTASSVPPHSTCPSVTSSLVPLWERAAALICVYSWRVLGLPLALGVVPPSGVPRSLARPRSQLASCVMF